MTDDQPHYMLNRVIKERRDFVARLIGEAVIEGNTSYTASELGCRVIRKLEANDYEIVWLGKRSTRE